MNSYKLLTPGPLTTTETVKQEMLVDHCTWDDDYKIITQAVRKNLLELAQVSAEEYTVVLMQGSGSFGVESVLSSVIPQEGKLLILSNGAYGERLQQMCLYHGISHCLLSFDYAEIPAAAEVEEVLKTDTAITHVAMVHSETTTGIINDLASIGTLCQSYDKTFIVDAMSSFGGMTIPVKELGIDFLISSANKCIQGVPGFSFIIANKEKLVASKGLARSLSLDLYDQWEVMDQDGKWRFTSPTHVVLAFSKAIAELAEEGGITARNQRYQQNMQLLLNGFNEIGLKSYVPSEHQGPIIATFYYPDTRFSFQEMYQFIKERGYAIYPGKLMGMDTFRVGVIGEIYPEDVEKVIEIMTEYFAVTKKEEV